MTDYKNNFMNEYKQLCGKYPYTPFVLPSVKRIVVFGDIHGDYKMAIKLLLMSGVAKIVETIVDKNINKDINSDNDNDIDINTCKEEDNETCEKTEKILGKSVYHNNFPIRNDVIYRMKWTGGKTHVVQVGDQVDRCRVYGSMTCDLPETTLDDENSDYKIMQLFTDLDIQAVKEGGRVISLLGNHEINNALGNMSYVSVKGIDGFSNYKDPKTGEIYKDGMTGRKHAFAPGNEIGLFMGCTRNPAVIIGSNLFVHAGIVNELINEHDKNGNKLDYFRLNYKNKYYFKKSFKFKDREDFENVNILIKRWLMNKVGYKNVKDLILDPSQEKSMFWVRILGMIKSQLPYDDDKCVNNIDNILKLFKVNNIIVGHTPQSFQHSLHINATCGDKVWRVDTGSSAAFDRFDETYVKTGNMVEPRKFQYLEILNDTQFNICFDDKCINGNIK